MSEKSHPSIATYLIIFFTLAIGTCLTWAIAFVDLGRWNPIIALTIACTKATLVILYFMHVRYSNKLTILTVCAGFFWLLILITLSLTDYLTRTVTP